MPVLHFLSTGQSCHHFHHQLESLHDLGIRLITPERPGTGKSTMKNNYSFKDIADDNSTLLRYLGIAKVSCIAFANGAPYAASFAYHYPELVNRVASVSSMLPTAFSNNSGILNKRSMLLKISQRSPSLHASLLRMILRSMERNPNTFITEHSRDIHPNDARTATPAMVQAVIKSFLAATANSMLGAIHDHRQTCNDWGFTPAQLQVPFTIWHGSHNSVIRCAEAKSFAASIPNASFREIEGGHLIFYSHFHKILQHLVSASHQSP